MKIGIDCRIYGPKHTGIGRYVQNLVENLLIQDKENEYVLFINKDSENDFENLKLKIKNSFQISNCKFQIVFTDVSHYSLQEQLLLPKLIKKQKVDLMHFPHFNAPVFYGGKYVVTIHDLIKHLSKGPSTTTRCTALYWLKYLGYKIVFKQAVKRAEKIITPSQYVKDELIKLYKVGADKVIVTYEGVDNKFQANTKYKIPNTKYKIKNPFLLYVGSVYPHKNIERLIEAVKLIDKKLVIVCARNVFRDRLNNFIAQNSAEDLVTFTGYVSNDELARLYQEAEAFVFPTLSEGFGLPGLEAMSLGCPVICSDISVLKEVYKNAAVYFNPLDSKDVAEKIKLVISDKEILEKLKKQGLELVKEYSWQKMAQETLKIYKEAA